MNAAVRQEFRLPDVGEGLTEAEVVAWRVAPGDTVAINDVLVEVETAKAAVELPSPFAGTVEALLVEPGRPVPVGTPIIAITTAGSGDAGAGPADGTEAVGQPDAAATLIGEAGPDGRIATLVGYGPRPGAARRRPRRAARPLPKRPRRRPRLPLRPRSCRSPSRPSASWRATSASTCTPSPARAPAG